MNIRIVNFQTLVANYSVYRDGYDRLVEIRKDFLEKLEPLRSEINKIMKDLQSGFMTDMIPVEEKQMRFQELQQEIILKDEEYKKMFKEENDTLNNTCFDNLSKIINEWVADKDIDLIIGEMEVVYARNSVNITDDIIEVLKEKNLYKEYKEEEYQDI